MNRLYQKCVRGLLFLGLLAAISACNTSDSQRSHAPTDPLGRGRAIWQSNFYVSRGNSDSFGVYNGDGFFQVQVPAGDYALTYTTDDSTFHIVFRALENARLMIGLNPDDEVQEATVYQGAVTDTSDADPRGTVILYSELGATGSWSHLFRQDASIPEILLIGGVGVNYVPGETFELYFPSAGTYLFTYTTTLGTFQITIEIAENNEIYPIGLPPGDEVLEAYILRL